MEFIATRVVTMLVVIALIMRFAATKGKDFIAALLKVQDFMETKELEADQSFGVKVIGILTSFIVITSLASSIIAKLAPFTNRKEALKTFRNSYLHHHICSFSSCLFVIHHCFVFSFFLVLSFLVQEEFLNTLSKCYQQNTNKLQKLKLHRFTK